jgi:predicted RNase H-like nuclease
MGGEIPQLRDEERLQAPSIEGADAHGSLRSALLTILDTQMPKEPEGNQPTPVLVLGIDAAWTPHNPSGVALVQRAANGWQCLALAPSYDSFLAIAAGEAWDQSRKAQGSEPDPAALLEACKQLAGQPVDCVSVDMPLATTPITSRRYADTAIASSFGPKGCAVHSPSAERPGTIADQLRERFAELGVPLHTTTPPRQGPALIECYPHVALLALLNRDYRVPYKVSRSAQYWKAERPPIAERLRRLLAEFTAIHQALSQRISAIPLTLPQSHEVTTLSSLKPVEDMLDALICAWIGIEHLEGRTIGLGDATAAIWVPQALTNHSPR